MDKKRVVITGMGAITPIGTGLESYFEALKAGLSGAATITRFDASEYATTVACEVKDFDPETYLSKKEARRMDRFSQFAVSASIMAMTDAGLVEGTYTDERAGVIIGSGIGGIETLEKEHEKLLNKGPGRVSPFLIPMMITNIGSGYIAMQHGLKGPNSTVVTACASATHAMGEAFETIVRGDADVMVTGGAEAAISPLGFAGFCTMKAMSTRNEDPTTASRPFDRDRDGFVMGEGAGMLVFESLDHALARGAKIYGEVLGYGATADAYHITSPAPGGEGAARAMKRAIERAGLRPEDVDYVNAHGTSTPYNDKFETQAILSVFGDHAKALSVSSTKSMTGHLLGASGAVELIATLLGMQEGYVHATINVQNQDEEIPLDVVPNQGKHRKVDVALSNSLGFGGHNGSIVVGAYKE